MTFIIISHIFPGNFIQIPQVIVAQKLEVELNNSFFGKKGDEVLGQTKILKLVKNELVEFS